MITVYMLHIESSYGSFCKRPVTPRVCVQSSHRYMSHLAALRHLRHSPSALQGLSSVTVSCRGRPQSDRQSCASSSLVFHLLGDRQLRHGFLDPQSGEPGGRVGVPALSHQLPHHAQSLGACQKGDSHTQTEAEMSLVQIFDKICLHRLHSLSFILSKLIITEAASHSIQRDSSPKCYISPIFYSPLWQQRLWRQFLINLTILEFYRGKFMVTTHFNIKKNNGRKL